MCAMSTTYNRVHHHRGPMRPRIHGPAVGDALGVPVDTRAGHVRMHGHGGRRHAWAVGGGVRGAAAPAGRGGRLRATGLRGRGVDLRGRHDRDRRRERAMPTDEERREVDG